ncbi:MAG: Gfo/Idh/MocA family protein, partial [Planctomycetaceae bacterium]
YHGGWKPKGAEVYDKHSAVLFEGEDGRLLADYGTRKLFMQSGKTAEAVEPSIPASPGQQQEWLNAIRGGSTPLCNFEYGGTLTETVHLGNVSYRLGGVKLAWDAENLRSPGTPAADRFIKREYREGWTL